MYLIFSASKDNYITNKIISTSLSASDANVGQASTLDLFKLYNETPFSGYTGSFDAPVEYSRILVAFKQLLRYPGNVIILLLLIGSRVRQSRRIFRLSP